MSHEHQKKAESLFWRLVPLILSPSAACTSPRAASAAALVLAKSAEAALLKGRPWTASKWDDDFFLANESPNCTNHKQLQIDHGCEKKVLEFWEDLSRKWTPLGFFQQIVFHAHDDFFCSYLHISVNKTCVFWNWFLSNSLLERSRVRWIQHKQQKKGKHNCSSTNSREKSLCFAPANLNLNQFFRQKSKFELCSISRLIVHAEIQLVDIAWLIKNIRTILLKMIKLKYN